MTVPIAPASIGSPMGVPVPCASTKPISAGGQIGVGEQIAQHCYLGILAWRGDGVGGPVLVGHRRLDHRMDAVAIGLCPAKRFQHDHAHTFAPDKAIGRRVKGRDPPGGRDHASLGKRQEGRRVAHGIHPAHNRHVTGPAAQVPDRLVQRRQGRRTGGIHRIAGTVEIEPVRNPVGVDAQRIPGSRIAFGGGDAHLFQGAVFGLGHADEHPGALARKLLQRDLRVQHRIDGALQHHPLLRVHPLRLTRGNAEELGVEATDVINEPGPFADRFRNRVGVGVIEHIHGPAVGGDLNNTTLFLKQKFPKRLGAGIAARQGAGHADDGNRLV